MFGSSAASNSGANSSDPSMSATNQPNDLNRLGVGSGPQFSSGTSSAPNLFPGPSSSAGTNPEAVNWTLLAEISGNNSRDTVTTAAVSTGQTGGSNAAGEYGPEHYVDHTTNSITWERPSNQPLPAGQEMGRDSREWSNSASTFVKITVSRTNVFEDSFRVIQEIKNPLDLRRQLDIRFQGEERLDYGDVAGEWFLLLSREVFNPMHRLFVHAGNNNNLLKINPAFVDPNCLKYFEFIGRFIAMALFHSKFVYSGFTMPFYKKILNKKVTLKDIEQVDPEFYNSVVQIKKNPIDRNQRRHFPGSHGLQIPVTDTNKDEYIDWLVEQQFNWGVERQTKAFFEGLNSVLPPKWLQNYDERKLELRLCGMQDVDVNDWEKNTIYTSCTRKSKQVTWFWQWVRSLNQEKRARLLQFVTGTCRVPVGGFSELMDSTGLQPFHIEGTRKRNGLPRSHTCSNTLYLPSYQSPEQLAEKLSNAIDNTEGFSNEE